MKLIFTDYPFSKQDAFVSGIENQETVDEFCLLFNIDSLEKNQRCKFSNKMEFNKIKDKLKSI